MSAPLHARAAAFDAVAEAYERGRPGWPGEAVVVARARLGLSPESAVLDLAAGTGKLTRELVPRFARVVAVEPLDGMRAELGRVVPGADALDGTAESIPLPDRSVDAVFVAEAFHWFDAAPAVAEIARVLRPGGGVAVVYNRRDERTPEEPWERDGLAVYEAHRLPPDDVDPFDQTAWRSALAQGFGPLREDHVPWTHHTDADGILATYASFSGLAGLPPDRRAAALAAIRDALARYELGEVEVPLTTTIVTARPPHGEAR